MIRAILVPVLLALALANTSVVVGQEPTTDHSARRLIMTERPHKGVSIYSFLVMATADREQAKATVQLVADDIRRGGLDGWNDGMFIREERDLDDPPKVGSVRRAIAMDLYFDDLHGQGAVVLVFNDGRFVHVWLAIGYYRSPESLMDNLGDVARQRPKASQMEGSELLWLLPKPDDFPNEEFVVVTEEEVRSGLTIELTMTNWSLMLARTKNAEQ